MDKAEAEKLLDHAITNAGEDGAYLYQLGNGELVVRIKASDYWLWSFADLTAFCKEAKKQRRRERKASTSHEQVGIDPEVSYHLAFA